MLSESVKMEECPMFFFSIQKLANMDQKKGAMLVFGAENPYPKDAVKPNTPLPK
jgi:hypothetical protein